MYGKQSFGDKRPAWRDASHVCALSDGDRHLGHIIFAAGQWYSFDATHLNDARNGFKYLGSFSSINIAKAVVEGSCTMDDCFQFSRRWTF